MSNWCNNILEISGKRREEAIELFKEMAKESSNQGQLPDFCQHKKDGWLFNIHIEDDFIQYETKWQPNFNIIKMIADMFKVSIVLEYEEPGDELFGRYIYDRSDSSETIQHFWVTRKQYEMITCMDDEYWYKGDAWDSESELLEYILEQNIKNG